MKLFMKTCVLILALVYLLQGVPTPKEDRRFDFDQPSIPGVSAVETDIVHLGSPIYIEDTVTYGWDAPNQARSVEELIPAAVEAAGVVDGMPAVEAIRLINKYLYNHVAYSEGRYCRTVYGALYLHQCVCVGFTLAFMYMCHYCGINAVYVHGWVGDIGHAWNGVYFSDGTYLEVDACFNNTSACMEKYFLLTPEEMTALGGHVRSTEP